MKVSISEVFEIKSKKNHCIWNLMKTSFHSLIQCIVCYIILKWILNRNDGRFYQRHVLLIHLVIYLYSSERVLIFIKSSRMLGQYLFLREPHRVNIRIEGYPFSSQIFLFYYLNTSVFIIWTMYHCIDICFFFISEFKLYFWHF